MREDRSYFVYIMTNQWHTVLYVGVTNDLLRRVAEHKNKIHPEAFTAKYELTKLVYFGETNEIGAAIAKEKQIKNWHRAWKENLIAEHNPTWDDLYPSLLGDAETSSA